MRAAIVFSLLSSILFTSAARAAPCAPSQLVIVLDRSSSMNGVAGTESKWSAARAAIDQVAAAYGDRIELGLATFPYPDQCGPGRLDVAPGLGRRDALATALAAPPPETNAWTPLGETLLALADDPAMVSAVAPAHAVVITDGFQWCSPFDPAARGLPLAGVEALGAAGVTTFVVGFGGGADEVTLDQMAMIAGTARAGCTPGSSDAATRCYYQAEDAAALLAALMDIAAVTSVETCDGEDDDCDGLIDEDACAEPGVDAGPSASADAGDELAVAPGGCGCGAARDAGATAGGVIAFGLGVLVALRWPPRSSRRRRRSPDPEPALDPRPEPDRARR